MIQTVVVWTLRRGLELGLYIAITGVCVIAWLWFFEEAPVRFYERTVITTEVRAGENLLIRSRAYRTKNCPTITQRVLYDGLGLEKKFEPDTQSNPGIGRELRTISIPIPRSAEPGDAVYKPTVCWSCNVMQEWYPRCAPLEDLHFRILPPAAPQRDGGLPLQSPPNVSIERVDP